MNSASEKIDPIQKRTLVFLQILLAVPYFQASGLIVFWAGLGGGILVLILAPYLAPVARKLVAGGYAITGAVSLLVIYGWQDISAIAIFFFIVGFAKIVEINTHRDVVFQVFLLIVQTVFVLLLTPVFTTFVISAVEILGIVLVTQNVRHFSLRGWLRSLGLLAAAVPMALIFFLFFPRFNANLFDLGMMMGLPGAFQLSQGEAMPLNDSVGFDDLAAKSKSDTRVLIANFHEGVDPFFNGIPPLRSLYWRGPVLWTYENNKWLPRKGWTKRSNRMRGSLSEEQIYNQIERTGQLSAYSVALFPSNSYWTYALDLPTRSAASTYVTQDFQLLNLNPIRDVLKYHMSSFLGYRMKSELSAADRALALTVDPDLNPRLQQFSNEIQQGTNDTPDFVNKVLKHFNAGFAYDPGAKSNAKINAMDAFLFDEKIGNSAHYASAFALIMRHGGVPTRLVAGYRGGNVVGLTEMVLILENSAYVWAESWIKGRGWVRIDPAMPVAGPPGTGGGGWGLSAAGSSPQNKPGEKEASADQKKEMLPSNQKSTDQEGGLPTGILTEQELSWFDTFQSDWVSWINKFDSDVQKESFLTGSEDLKKESWLDLILMLGAGCVGVLVTAAMSLYLYGYLRRRRKAADPLKREFDLFIKSLIKKKFIPLRIGNISAMLAQISGNESVLSEGARTQASFFLTTYAEERYSNNATTDPVHISRSLKLIRKQFETAK